MKKILTIIILLVPSLLFSKKVINSGHQSPVKFIKYLEHSDSYFSLSEDGTLVIKKSDSEKIYKRFFLTSNTVTSISISPNKSQLAIVEAVGTTNFLVSVWDYEKEVKLYSLNFTNFPMTIGFTGGGTYLYITSISNNPIQMFNAQTGASAPYLNRQKSFIDYMYIGSSEKHALLYSSSGTVEFKDLKSFKTLKTFKTVRNLKDILVSSDKAFLIGRDGNKIYLIGRTNGKVYDEKKIDDLSFYKLNSTTGELICYIDSKYSKSVEVWEIVSGKFFNTPKEVPIKTALTSLSGSYNSIIYADSKGDLHKIDRNTNSSTVFVENKIKDITGITIIGDVATLTTEDKIYLFKSDYFSDQVKNSNRLSNFSIKDYESPVINPKGTREYNGNLLIWNEELVLFNIETGESIFSIQFSSEIVDVKIKDNKLLVLDQNGLIQIMNLETNEKEFEFKSPGFTTVSFYSDNEILGGVGASSESALMILDLQTKETIPYKTSMDAVFNIIPSNTSYIAYIYGLKKVAGKNETYFIEYNLLTKREKTLLKKNAEVLDSNFEIDHENTIYTNMSTKSILKINSKPKSIKPFQPTTNQTSYILHKNNSVYTINENHSLSIWNPESGKKVIDFYLFNDSEWVAISSDNTSAFGSPESKKYISSN